MGFQAALALVSYAVNKSVILWEGGRGVKHLASLGIDQVSIQLVLLRWSLIPWYKQPTLPFLPS